MGDGWQPLGGNGILNGVQRGLNQGNEARSGILGGINRRADNSLYDQGQPRNSLPPEAQGLLEQYSMGQDAGVRQALRFVMTYPNRGGPGGTVGAWPSGGKFPTAQDLAQALPRIQQELKGRTAQGGPGAGLKGLLSRMMGGQ